MMLDNGGIFVCKCRQVSVCNLEDNWVFKLTVKRVVFKMNQTRVLFDSGFVGIKCFFVVTFVNVAHKLQHLWQI